MCPFKTFRDMPSRSEWLMADILERLDLQDPKFKIARSIQDNKDWENAKKMKNEINIDCENAKNELIKSKLNEYKLNPMKFWEVLTPIVNPQKIDKNQN